MKFIPKEELKKLLAVVKQLDKKVIIIFVSVAILQTVSWYYTSRRFFRLNLYSLFAHDPNVQLYEYIFWFVGDFFTYFVLPVLIIYLIHKDKPRNFGLRFGEVRTGLWISLIFLFVMIIIVWFVSAMPEFSSKYPHLYSVKSDWTVFLIYETGMLLYMFAWEFVWRGYMLFGLEEKFGFYAVLIQMLPFVILHNGKPEMETFSAIIGAIALGILAFRTRSFLYGVLLHFGTMLSIDFISSMRYRVNEFGTGLDSLIKIISSIF